MAVMMGEAPERRRAKNGRALPLAQGAF